MNLSLQLYTLRTPMEHDLKGTLQAVKATGLGYVELAGTYGKSAVELSDLLNEIGLTVSASHTPLSQLEGDIDQVIADNQVWNNASVVLPWVSAADYADGWAKLGERITPIAKQLKAAGLSLAYHNHDFEFKLDGTKPGLDVLYDSTDPELLKAQLDLAWILQGGGDPVAYIERYAHRLDSVHLKDTVLGNGHQDAVAGTGSMPWDSILAACDAANCHTGSVEMDNAPGDPVESVRASVEFFHSKGLR